MLHPDRKMAKRVDMPGRCREFTDLVYSGRQAEGFEKLWARIQQSERKFDPPAPEYHPYIGEMHGHCCMSDGVRTLTPELYFERLKALPGLDFAALTDHDHGGVATAELWDEGKWERIQKAVQTYYEAGKFTTLLAYERDSYPWYNNMVIYYKEDHGEMVRGVRDGEITHTELKAALDRDDLLIVPHDTHFLSAGCDFGAIPLDLMTHQRTQWLHSTCRQFADCRCYLIANTKSEMDFSVTVSLPDTGKIVEWYDPESNQFYQISQAARKKNRIEFSFDFAAGEAALFFVCDTPHSQNMLPQWPELPKTYSMAFGSFGPPMFYIEDTSQKKNPKQCRLDTQWTLQQHSGNLLTLDRCQYQVNNGKWIRDDVSVIHGRLLKLQKECHLKMRFKIETTKDFKNNSPLYLVLETPERFTITLNGQPVDNRDAGQLFDQAFRKVALPALHPGTNILQLETDFHEPPQVYETLEAAKKFETEYNKLVFYTEIESIYLLGDFRVQLQGEEFDIERNALRFDGNFILTSPEQPEKVDGAKLVRQGFPFFAGTLTLSQKVKLTQKQVQSCHWLRLKPMGANSYRIWLNGKEVGFLHSGKYLAPLQDACRVGENLLEIELTTSLRNMLGPHHLEEGESFAVTPLCFNREANAAGWEAQPYNPGYCFVKIGIQEIEFV